MAQQITRSMRVVALAVLALAACAAFPLVAGAADVTVRVEGENGNLLSARTVTIGDGSGAARTWDGSGTLPHGCADDTASQAIELATAGDWDRSEYVGTLLGESLSWVPDEQYWIFYYNHNYADWGVCAQHLRDGDSVLMQAGVSGPSPDFIPDAVPIELTRVAPASGSVGLGRRLTVKLTKWRPTDIFGAPDPNIPGHWIIPPSPATDAVGYTVTAGSARATTDANGEATLTMPAVRGLVSVEASMPGSATNWSRAIPLSVCVSATTC